MTIRLSTSLRIAGTAQASGTYADLASDAEAQLVAAGFADFVGEDTRQFSVSRREVLPGTLGVVGDSFSAQDFNDTSSYDYKNADGWITWGLALSGQRLTPVVRPARGNSRLSAEATAPGVRIANQLSDVIRSPASDVVIMAGINDAFAGYSLQQITAAYYDVLRQATDAGLRVWLVTQPTMNSSHGSYSTDAQGRVFAINEWCRQQASTTWARFGLVLVDGAAAAVDASSATGNWRANGSQDNLHPRNVGAYWVGKEWARMLSLYVPDRNILVSSNADNYAYSQRSVNLAPNGVFATGSGTATGYTGTAIVGGASTNSLVSHTDGFGNWQQMVQTASAANDGYHMACASVHANGLVAGDIVQAACEVDVSSMTNCMGDQLQLVANGATASKSSWDGYIDTAADTALPEAYRVTRLTPWVKIEGAPSSVYARVTTYYSGAGGATVKMGRFSLRKLGAFFG